MSNQSCKSAEFAMTRHQRRRAPQRQIHQQRPRPRFGRRCPSLAGEEHSEAATLARASVGVVATSPASRGGLPRERASVRDRTARGLSTWRPRRRSRCAPHHSGARRRRIFSVSSSSLPAPSGVRSVKGRRRASPLLADERPTLPGTACDARTSSEGGLLRHPWCAAWRCREGY